MKARWILASAAAPLLAAPALGQSLCELPVTTYLTDGDGVALDGSLDVELRFYVEPGEDTPPAECRSFSAVSVINGWMRVSVDVCSPPVAGDCGAFALTDILRDADGLWVGVEVGGEELGPRLPIGAVPFAVQAADANTLQGAGPDAFEASGAIADHAANPDAHHSSTSDGIHITPGSVTIGDTAINDGEVDFGAAADDELTAEMVQTLTGGGDADALHMHPAGHGGGGGGCYVAVGLASCGEGYSAMYTGAYVDSVTQYSNAVTQSHYCLADAAVDRFHPDAGHLNRDLMTTGGLSGNERPILIDDRLLCAMCCP